MSSIIIVLPKIEDAKKIKKILMQHGFDNIISCTTGASALMEMNKQSGGLVISGYKLPDMYYTELADMIPSFYEILLIGSANVVSSAQSGIMAVTMPIRVHELVNTVEMQMMQIQRRLKKQKKKPKPRSERAELYSECKAASDGQKPSDRGRSLQIYTKVQYGQCNQYGRDCTDDIDFNL